MFVAYIKYSPIFVVWYKFFWPLVSKFIDQIDALQLKEMLRWNWPNFVKGVFTNNLYWISCHIYRNSDNNRVGHFTLLSLEEKPLLKLFQKACYYFWGQWKLSIWPMRAYPTDKQTANYRPMACITLFSKVSATLYGFIVIWLRRRSKITNSLRLQLV